MAEILITQNDRRRQVTAIGAEPSVTFDFPIFEEDQISVLRTAFDTGLTAPLVLNIDYTVSGIGVQAGGTVIFDTVVFPTGLSAGDVITLSGDAPIKRITDFQTVGDYFAADINRELDTITIVQQELDTKAAMTIHTKPEDTTVENDLLLPLPADRASQVLSFDPTGKIVTSALGTIPSLPVSAFMATVLGAANAPSARNFQQTWKLGALAGGSVDVITAVIGATVLVDGMVAIVRAIGVNTVTGVTFNLDSLGAKTVLKGTGVALLVGDIEGANHDLFLEYNLALDKWLLLNPVTPATLPAVGAGQWRRIQTQNASASASIDFVLPAAGTFDRLRVRLFDVVLVTDANLLHVLLSTDGGATFDNTNEYDWRYSGTVNVSIQSGTADSEIETTAAVGNGAGETLNGDIEIIADDDATLFTQGNWVFTYLDAAGGVRHTHGNFKHVTAEVHDAIRFIGSTAGITSGKFVLEGLVS